MNQKGVPKGRIDTTTVYGLLSCLSFPSPKDCYPWAWQDAIELTASLAGTDHLALSPVPRPAGRAGGLLNQTLERLVSLGVPLQTPTSEADRKTAETRTATWLKKNASIVQGVFNNHVSDSLNYQKWIEWHVANVWPEHCQRVGGLTDSFFDQRVTGLLDLDTENVREIQQLSANRNTLEELRTGRLGEFLLASAMKIYTMSILVRGIYYDFLAQAAKTQILHHHVRQNLWNIKPGKNKVQVYRPTSTEMYLYTILVASAFRARSPEQRASEWAGLTTRVKALAQQERIDLSERTLDSAALDEAIRIARTVGVSVLDKAVEKWITVALEAGADLVVGTLVGLAVQNAVVGGAASAVTGVVMRQPKVRDTASEVFRRVVTPESKLRELATAGPGRILRKWSGLTIESDQ